MSPNVPNMNGPDLPLEGVHKAIAEQGALNSMVMLHQHIQQTRNVAQDYVQHTQMRILQFGLRNWMQLMNHGQRSGRMHPQEAVQRIRMTNHSLLLLAQNGWPALRVEPVQSGPIVMFRVVPLQQSAPAPSMAPQPYAQPQVPYQSPPYAPPRPPVYERPRPQQPVPPRPQVTPQPQPQPQKPEVPRPQPPAAPPKPPESAEVPESIRTLEKMIRNEFITKDVPAMSTNKQGRLTLTKPGSGYPALIIEQTTDKKYSVAIVEKENSAPFVLEKMTIPSGNKPRDFLTVTGKIRELYVGRINKDLQLPENNMEQELQKLHQASDAAAQKYVEWANANGIDVGQLLDIKKLNTTQLKDTLNLLTNRCNALQNERRVVTDRQQQDDIDIRIANAKNTIENIRAALAASERPQPNPADNLQKLKAASDKTYTDVANWRDTMKKKGKENLSDLNRNELEEFKRLLVQRNAALDAERKAPGQTAERIKDINDAISGNEGVLKSIDEQLRTLALVPPTQPSPDAPNAPGQPLAPGEQAPAGTDWREKRLMMGRDILDPANGKAWREDFNDVLLEKKLQKLVGKPQTIKLTTGPVTLTITGQDKKSKHFTMTVTEGGKTQIWYMAQPTTFINANVMTFRLKDDPSVLCGCLVRHEGMLRDPAAEAANRLTNLFTETGWDQSGVTTLLQRMGIAVERSRQDKENSARAKEVKVDKNAPIGYLGVYDQGDATIRSHSNDLHLMRESISAKESGYNVPPEHARVYGTNAITYDFLDKHITALKSQKDANGKLIRTIFLDIAAHGSPGGIATGNKITLRPQEMEKLLDKHQDCTFVVNTTACFGGGLATAMRGYVDSSTSGRQVIMMLQTYEDFPNGSLLLGQDPNTRTNQNTSGFTSALCKLMRDPAHKNKTLGELFVMTEEAVKLALPYDAELWVAKKGTAGVRLKAIPSPK